MVARKRKVGIVGLGTVAEPHLLAYGALTEVEVVGVADPRIQRREEIAERYRVSAYENCAQLLAAEHPDIVCVLTPASTHRAIVEECARFGAHVLCEKPLAVTVEDAQAIVRACRDSNVELCYGSSYRHLPGIIAAKCLIDSGDIGAVRLIVEQTIGGCGAENYRPLSAIHYPPGGPGGGGYGMVDHGIHMLDIFPWLCGSALELVLGNADRTGQAARPEFAWLKMTNGALGQLLYDQSTWPTHLPGEGVFSEGKQWVDERGWVGEVGRWDAAAGHISVYGDRGSLRIYHYANQLLINRGAGTRSLPLSSQTTPWHFGAQMRSFCTDLDAGQSPACGANEALAALRALHALYESQSTGCWQALASMASQ
jgi:predicted dehydrogenase